MRGFPAESPNQCGPLEVATGTLTEPERHAPPPPPCLASPEPLLRSLIQGDAKLADFGMASVVPPGAKLMESVGSPHYACPQIIEGKKYSGYCSDVWSLGVWGLCYLRLYCGHPGLLLHCRQGGGLASPPAAWRPFSATVQPRASGRVLGLRHGAPDRCHAPFRPGQGVTQSEPPFCLAPFVDPDVFVCV